ncbi:hypothetical protein QE450_000816 [Paenibacillus sp. SORGH_AS306]|uniref:hypothetical protein n=1 Tax=unclassified Paenibacillus TaxID=185978 RepID=UPI0027898F10|nr:MULTISPECIES: hypothetical protein [unclassified Paenibacillus]MDQ1233318.1 hypothetical protein [Paenibacillus sp. SORGH_AS_0306]MDR6110360.1 hypothetical protein [Paenibacillus sp. SORGH_AS_0338]
MSKSKQVKLIRLQLRKCYLQLPNSNKELDTQIRSEVSKLTDQLKQIDSREVLANMPKKPGRKKKKTARGNVRSSKSKS